MCELLDLICTCLDGVYVCVQDHLHWVTFCATWWCMIYNAVHCIYIANVLANFSVYPDSSILDVVLV